jgi:hypothetical protein
MNKAKLIELLKDGAVFDTNEEKFYHSSFRKGWRKLTYSNISWQSVRHELGLCGSNQLQGIAEGRITLKS